MLCLPYFSEDVVMEHIERFLKREKLMEEKKKLTQEWKDIKKL